MAATNCNVDITWNGLKVVAKVVKHDPDPENGLLAMWIDSWQWFINDQPVSPSDWLEAEWQEAVWDALAGAGGDNNA